MTRVPIVPTLLVLVAVAAMVALGLWQLLDRRPAKLAYLAEVAANPSRPPVAFPNTSDQSLLLRRASNVCRPPVSVTLAGAGAAGFRAIATCANGMTVQLGTTRDPMARPIWSGGAVSGFISHAPDTRSLLGALADRRPSPLMLVADTPPVPGLTANARPSLDAIPNNHLAYAVQWLFFAGVASVIYALALRRRVRTQPAGSG